MPRPHVPTVVTFAPRPRAGAPVCARVLPRLQGALIAAWAFTPAAG